MNYITLIDLAERPGARELAQVASSEHEAMVVYELMEASLRGDDRSAWDSDDVAQADIAIARIEEAVAEAESIIDGNLAVRNYPLPLSPVPKLVTGWTRDIARYLLHKDRISDEKSDPIARAYRDAMKLLAQTANGTFSLGANDPIKNDPASLEVEFTSDTQVFSRTELRRFR